mgnify:CR=1 FL=1
MCVWNATDGKLVISFEWKNTAKDGPKSVTFDDVEKLCARQATKTDIEIYDVEDFSKTKMQIRSKLPPPPKVDG